MNGKTAKLLNKYVAHVYAVVTKGKHLPPHSQRTLRNITKRKVYAEWNACPRPKRSKMRNRLLHEIQTGTVTS
jgi:hypothetical protein